MSDYINVDEGKQDRQKPPRNLGRIAGEILTGTATGATAAALAYLFFYMVGYGVKTAGLGEEGCMGNFVLWVIAALMFMFVPPLYVLGCAVGVYFIGRIGNQTGSFWVTLGGVFLGLPVMALLYFYIGAAEKYNIMTLGIEKIILWPLVFVAAPATATLCFNLTRRYKEPPSS